MQNRMTLLSGKLIIERENYDIDKSNAQIYDIIKWKIHN